MKLKAILTISIGFLLISSSCKFIERKGWFGRSKVDTMIVWQAQQDSIRAADSIKAEIDRMRAIEQARVDSLQLLEQARLEMEARFKYHIIVGSFITPEYAVDFQTYYQLMGYDAKIIDGPRGRFKLVSAEVHEKFNTAVNRLNLFQDTVNFESWLYIRD